MNDPHAHTCPCCLTAQMFERSIWPEPAGACRCERCGYALVACSDDPEAQAVVAARLRRAVR